MSGIVRGVHSWSGHKDVRLNIRDGERTRVIGEIRMEVGREGGKEGIALGGTKTGPIMLEEGELGELTMSDVGGGMAASVVRTNVGHGGRKLGP